MLPSYPAAQAPMGFSVLAAVFPVDPPATIFWERDAVLKIHHQPHLQLQQPSKWTFYVSLHGRLLTEHALV